MEYRIFKTFYCGTCAALRVNYGRLSTAVLSYDLVIVPIILSRRFEIPSKCEKCNFYKGKNTGDYCNDFWKRIAAFNLAMTYAHINDNSNDENRSANFKYKIINLILKKGLKKAKADYPHLFELCDNGIAEICKAENNNEKLSGQSEAFSKMCITMLEELFDITIEEKELYKSISYWLCFIDAVDDYEKDRKKSRYNPLADKYETRYEFISSNYIYLFKEYSKIYESIKESYKALKQTKSYSGISLLCHIVYKVMPLATARVLQKK